MQARKADNVAIIDVSHHQGTINWQAVAAAKVGGQPVKGAMIKATEGVTGRDAQLQRNATGALAAGLPIGFYHYCRAENGNDPKKEAQSFVAAVKPYVAALPYVLDVEGDAGKIGKAKLTAWCLAWLQEVQRLTGHNVMIYTGASFAGSYLGKELADYPLWVAHYGVSQPMNNSTWTGWAMFQYTSEGTCAGISGNVDLNVMEIGFYRRFVPGAASPPAAAQADSGGPKPAGPDYTAKIVVNDKLVGYGRVVDGRLEAQLGDVLTELGIMHKWDNETKKLYIYG